MVAVHNFGAGDLIELRRDGDSRTELMPFDEATVPVVDLTAGRIVVALPAIASKRLPRRSRRLMRNGQKVREMWRASVLTIFPDMFPGPLGASLAGKALASGRLGARRRRYPRFATDKHRSVDDTPAGGGPGMVMKADVLAAPSMRPQPIGGRVSCFRRAARR